MQFGVNISVKISVRENCSNTELFLVRIRTRNNSVFGHFSRSSSFSYPLEWHRTVVSDNSLFLLKRDRCFPVNIEKFLRTSANGCFFFHKKFHGFPIICWYIGTENTLDLKLESNPWNIFFPIPKKLYGGDL